MSFFKRIFRNRRQEELQKVAYQNGMTFSAKDEFNLNKRLEEFSLFKIGHSRKIQNLMTDQDSWLKSSFAVFDYQYTVQSGKTPVTFQQTVFFADSKNLGLPKLMIKPEYFYHRLGKFFNLVSDIEMAKYPDFSKLYLIQSDFPSMLEDLVSDQLVQFLVKDINWTVEGLNYYMILYKKNKRLPPRRIGALIEEIRKVITSIEDLSQDL